jgi:hypothetical protein
MEIHMIGHASIFVKTKDCRILIDPVFDPFGEGTNQVCPKRQLIPEQIPEFDFLVISHKHTDHFDIRTLAFLPKTVDVLIPRDTLIENCLRQLGYSQIYPLKDFSEVRMGSTSFFTTRSEQRVPEYGLVIADESGVFWNQVDTDVSPNTISLILSRYGKIDLLFAKWQPMLEINYQLNQNLSFPYLRYNQLLCNISRIQPKAVVPGSNGFKYINDSSWLNQIVFPVTREQFCQDVSYVCPGLGQNIFALNPGDILTFSNGIFHYLAASCDYVKTVEDDRASLEFAPVKIGADLKDKNIESYDIESMKQVIEEEILSHLPKYIMNNYDSIFQEYQKWKIIYQLEIIFSGFSQRWSFDFSEKKINPCQGYNPLANFFSYITASSFYGILKKNLSRDYALANGSYRSYNKVYSVSPVGLTYPDPTLQLMQDPLRLKLSESHQNSAPESVLYREIEKWACHNAHRAKSNKSKNPMIKMGDVLLKPTKQPQ